MNFSIKALLAATAWVGFCCALAVPSHLYVNDYGVIAAWFALSLSLTAPFVVRRRLKPFWTGYSITTSVFLLLILTKNEVLLRQSLRLAYLLAEMQGADPGSSSGLDLSPLFVAQALRFGIVPLFGLIAGAIWQSLVSRTSTDDEGNGGRRHEPEA